MRYTLGGASIYIRANGERPRAPSLSYKLAPPPVVNPVTGVTTLPRSDEGITSLIPSQAHAPGQQAPPPVLRIAESGTGSGSGAGYGFIPSQVETKPAQTAWLLPAALAALYFLS